MDSVRVIYFWLVVCNVWLSSITRHDAPVACALNFAAAPAHVGNIHRFATAAMRWYRSLSISGTQCTGTSHGDVLPAGLHDSLAMHMM